MDIDETKQELIKQAEQLPEDVREQFVTRVQEMSEQELQDFLKQLAQKQNSWQGECLFCSIANGKVSSFKVFENEKFSAVLDINPVSEGHILLVPKKHVESLEKLENKKEMLLIVEELSKKMKQELGVHDVAVLISSAGHLIIQLIPVYQDTVLQFSRKKIEKEKMEEIAGKLKCDVKIELKKERVESKKEIQREEETIEDKLEQAPRRIP
ncbi:hypothetical protein COV15_02650 [Candidatus Woesearchaeota archaeon CG10_big_fil_rev_8_21_14_0_10_34_12]|nr:MAG: hypothetical protein COV15_02650 [Candidatus Woesearchaeota archaeon CG10_big_fil_rev_8_21_14_0_10_34_12]